MFYSSSIFLSLICYFDSFILIFYFLYHYVGHDRSATEINLPCKHRVLCFNCSQSHLEQNGNVCSQCQQASTIFAPATQILCALCYEEWETGYTVRSSDTCNHHLCIGCLTPYLRHVLNNRQQEFESPNFMPGMRCPMAAEGCTARVGISRIRIAKRVSEAHLPHHRIEDALAQIPLTQEEMDRYERFSNEGIIPTRNRMFCVNVKCQGKDMNGNRFVLNSELEKYLVPDERVIKQLEIEIKRLKKLKNKASDDDDEEEEDRVQKIMNEAKVKLNALKKSVGNTGDSAGETKETKETDWNICPEGALRVQPGLNSLSNAVKEAKEKKKTCLFLESGVYDEEGEYAEESGDDQKSKDENPIKKHQYNYDKSFFMADMHPEMDSRNQPSQPAIADRTIHDHIITVAPGEDQKPVDVCYDPGWDVKVFVGVPILDNNDVEPLKEFTPLIEKV